MRKKFAKLILLLNNEQKDNIQNQSLINSLRLISHLQFLLHFSKKHTKRGEQVQPAFFSWLHDSNKQVMDLLLSGVAVVNPTATVSMDVCFFSYPESIKSINKAKV